MSFFVLARNKCNYFVQYDAADFVFSLIFLTLVMVNIEIN